MAVYSSGSIHFSGLGSELDVDTLITDLYKIESKYAQKLLSWKSDWEIRLEAFQQLRSQLLSLQTTLQSMNTMDKFLVKNANSSDASVAATTATGEATEGVYAVQVNQLATNSIWSIDTGMASKSDVINDTGTEGFFTYTYKGEERTITVPNGTTLEGLKNLINNDSQNPGVKVQLIESASGVALQLRGMDTGESATLSIDSVSNIACLDVANGWLVQNSQNAQVRIDGWPATGWLEQESNSITGVVDGMTFNLRSAGETVVTVELDTAAIVENIEKFVQEVNNFRTVLQSLTTVDSEKTTVDPDYATSQFDMQSGSVLTGNYGVQMLSSTMKSLISAQAVGFDYDSDLFSSLAQIGITTDASQGSSTYGLLVINEVEGQYGSLTLTQALEKDPVAVARLFAAKSEAVCSSPHFSCNSHIETITKTGSYDVSYTVDDSGNIASATINGKEATIDQENRQIAIYSSTSPANNADGLVLDIHDLTPGATFTGTVRIRSGKINELLGMMDGSEGWLGEDGTLRILEDNYKTIINNIEEKITKEDQRLEKWESAMRAKFARLESVLATYNTINSNLESQLAQLNND